MVGQTVPASAGCGHLWLRMRKSTAAYGRVVRGPTAAGPLQECDSVRNSNQPPRGPGSGWQRPPVEERADQVRTWSEIAVAELRHPALPALAEAWALAAAREGVRPPSRDAFRPTEVVQAVGRISVLERVAVDPDAAGPTRDGTGHGHTWRYRLIGTEVVAMVQADLTGAAIDRYHPPLADMLRAQLDRAAAAGQPVAFAVRTVVDHRPYAYEKIVLPVRRAAAAPVDQMVVASFATDGP